MNKYHEKVHTTFTVWEIVKYSKGNWTARRKVDGKVPYLIGFNNGYVACEVDSSEWYDEKFNYKISLEFFDVGKDEKRNTPISMIRMDSIGKILRMKSFDGDEILDFDYEIEQSIQNAKTQTLIISLSIAIPLFVILLVILILSIVLFNKRNKK